MGWGTPEPNPHKEPNESVSKRSSKSVRGIAFFSMIAAVTNSNPRWAPNRQGKHLPHDSWEVNSKRWAMYSIIENDSGMAIRLA